MISLGIRGKVLLIFTTVTLIGGLALFLSAGLQLQNTTLQFYQQDLQTAALNLANGLAEPLQEGQGDTAGGLLQRILERNQVARGVTFTIVNPNLRVLASTANPQPPLDSQIPTTNEIVAALGKHMGHEVRRSATGELRVYSAVPILYEGRVVGVLQASAPMSTAYRQARDKLYSLAAVALPILLLTVGASLWLGRTLTHPIQQLRNSALHIADGALDERVEIKSRDEIGQLGQAFNYMAGRINALLATQRSFVSNAAHELRTPLMSLKLRIEALQDPAVSDEQKAVYLTELAREIEHMSTLITQLLILARLDEGRHQADQPPEDVAAFVQDMARTWRIRTQAAGLHFEADIPTVLPNTVVSASDLKIVLDNLLENAVKYTPPGGQVSLHVGQDTRAIRLIVSDTGEGFRPEETRFLFERFARLTRARENDIPGTGLGLAIVKAVLNQYGGTITARSDGPGQGATFDVVLPLAARPPV
jgi:two-component system sensor histidine kinase BaeS